MGFIEDELAEVKKLAEHVIAGCKLISCVKTLVRAEIKRTPFKTLVACIQFPTDYPKNPLLLELKSKTLSEKLLQGLTNVCESETKQCLGKPQILNVLRLLQNFLDENPLSCCYAEINTLKKKLNNSTDDEFKLKQKQSSLIVKFTNKEYYFSARIIVPDNYPDTAIEIDDVKTNFPLAFGRHLVMQAKELARQCVEPPLRKPKPNEPPFRPKPSLEMAAMFLIDCVKKLPDEKCQLCKQQCFPSNPQLAEANEESPNHIERIYCGHLFHLGCMVKYLKAPPFGNKTCQECGQRIYHHKWSLSDKLAENRWAHEQARARELSEVADFFK